MPQAAFQDAFRPLLADAEARLAPRRCPLVHSVYVYGSVAAGRALPGRSDLDLTLVLHGPAEDSARQELEAIRTALEAAHPVVAKVDFDIGSLRDLASQDSAMAWRYWLRHHCRCLAGADLSVGIRLFRPSKALALAVNGDFGRVLAGYRAALAQDPPEPQARRLMREAARKLVRSTNMLRCDSDPDWPETLEEHVERAARRHPARDSDLRWVLGQAREPDADPRDFAHRLGDLADWMERELR
ncbi:nucleotidyltransferase domain-containing protein [Mangrovicoccus ximenensis]|uniref:nucleotidyltransferase domain-containing protein n=1 Tax=Mangrovicoccus ximenensis TaxID=1911570 RepID=UPI0013753502|nr:nucleotidyltransferase domain-containing protein [Mangrovicoccus ximenensis]